MLKVINKIKACFGSNRMNEEEYKMALWEHEQIGHKLYSIGVAINKLKEM